METRVSQRERLIEGETERETSHTWESTRPASLANSASCARTRSGCQIVSLATSTRIKEEVTTAVEASRSIWRLSSVPKGGQTEGIFLIGKILFIQQCSLHALASILEQVFHVTQFR